MSLRREGMQEHSLRFFDAYNPAGAQSAYHSQQDSYHSLLCNRNEFA